MTFRKIYSSLVTILIPMTLKMGERLDTESVPNVGNLGNEMNLSL